VKKDVQTEKEVDAPLTPATVEADPGVVVAGEVSLLTILLCGF